MKVSCMAMNLSAIQQSPVEDVKRSLLMEDSIFFLTI